MKKFIVLLALAIAVVFTACGAEKTDVYATLEAKSCFGDAGFVEFIAGAEQDSQLTFTAENSADVEWSVYILDEAFEDGYRYIEQAFDPDLTGDGTVDVHKGQYVYVHCSANEFTTGVADEDAKLNIAFK